MSMKTRSAEFEIRLISFILRVIFCKTSLTVKSKNFAPLNSIRSNSNNGSKKRFPN